MEDKAVAAALSAARIPLMYHNRKLSEFRDGGLIAQYMTGEAYRSDRQNYMGACLVGDAEHRVTLLPMLARSMVISRDSVLYVSLDTLINIVAEDDHPLYETAFSVRALVMQDMSQPEEMPFTFGERRRMEDFLNRRTEGCLRNYYSSHVPFKDAPWWTENFKIKQEAQLRTISLV